MSQFSVPPLQMCWQLNRDVAVFLRRRRDLLDDLLNINIKNIKHSIIPSSLTRRAESDHKFEFILLMKDIGHEHISRPWKRKALRHTWTKVSTHKVDLDAK